MNGSGWIGLLLFIFALTSPALASQNLTAHFIDVGQGDSILLQFKDKSLLIDGGPSEMGSRLEEYLSRHSAMKNPWESIVVRAFSGDMNQNSMVLRITYGWFSLLLMGDADTVVEKRLVSSGFNLSSQILKVGHHGGTSASRPEFLEKIKPLISIISVGEGNYYGYPTKRTLEALQAVGSGVYRTDTCGDIIITTDGLYYTLSSEKIC